jgi:hypothetical protein
LVLSYATISVSRIKPKFFEEGEGEEEEEGAG